eukprot:m.36819 g.36819  ORF g.36819 m.36819 type:complete len:74 (+) comp6698_c0_seq1:440-661(+)
MESSKCILEGTPLQVVCAAPSTIAHKQPQHTPTMKISLGNFNQTNYNINKKSLFISQSPPSLPIFIYFYFFLA